jgi:CubicO group peptidase (beta-lactamase class C family)
MGLRESAVPETKAPGGPEEPEIAGFVAPGFEGVREAFATNFRDEGELGAAFAATVGGQRVVDVWGGMASLRTHTSWRDQTLEVIFSGTKGLVALCLLMLVDRGAVELEERVATYWPEFARAGKEDVRVVDLAAHRARLPGIRPRVSQEEILDGVRMAALLAEQPQEADPRAIDAYHPLTYGWLCGEVIRRVDGRTVGEFFADEVARPLDLDVWIGLEPRLESRVAELQYATNWGQTAQADPMSFENDELLDRVWNNPLLFPVGEIPWNNAAYHAAEIPGAGAIGTARSLARLYGCLALGGSLDGVRLISEETLAVGRRLVSRRWEPLVDEPLALGVGFQLQTEWRRYGPPADAFGHGGAGGSMHCAWPSLGVGLSYVMNVMRDDEHVDPRSARLLSALHDAVQSKS